MAPKGIWIQGVVSEAPNGYTINATSEHVFQLNLDPWHEVGQPRSALPLRVAMNPPSLAALRALVRRHVRGETRRLRVDRPKKSGSALYFARLLEIGRKVRDKVLEAEEEADARRGVRDDALGTLKRDREDPCFNGERTVEGRAYSLRVFGSGTCGKDASLSKEQLKNARTAIVRFEKKFASVRKAVSKKMVAAYNDDCVAEGDPRMTPEECWKTARLEGVTVEADGSLLALFDFEELLGQGVEVKIDSKGKVTRIEDGL
jgi:hypothetical protein